jgi:predicted TIM-barrel fold metal-dependent hydrolase
MNGSSHNHPSRRQFVAASSAVAVATALASHMPQSAAQAAGPDLAQHPWIDAHSHLWSPDLAKWPLANGKTQADLDPPSFTPEELLKLAHPEKVGRVVLIQHRPYHGWNNDYLIDCAARFPGTFAIVGMVDDTTPHPDLQMRELAPKGVCAFRINSGLRKDWLSGPGMAAMWKEGEKSGQAMCGLINPEDLPGLDAMCEKNPGTPVVIDHFARIGATGEIRDADVANLVRLARHKRVTLKLSAYYALGKKAIPYTDLLPLIRRMLDAFGPERCMWASDAPYQVVKGHTYAASVALLRDQADFLSPGDKEHLFRKTAERVYFS